MFLITQPAVYSVTWWLVFITISFCVACYTRWFCIPIGYLTVAIIIRIVDVAWVHYEMRQPGYDDAPDMDIIFALGMFIRIGFTWAALLPVTALGIWLRRRSRRMTNKSLQPLPMYC